MTKKKNHIEKRRKMVKAGILIAVISTITLTVAYAALSSTLKITGTGTVNASNWDIQIDTSIFQPNTTTGKATYTTPTITGTTIANYTASLLLPGDSVTLHFDVKNNGNLNAEIASIINNSPVCTSETGNTQDASLVCDNLEVTFRYNDYTEISVGDVINTSSEFCENGNDISSGITTLTVKIKLKDSMTKVPSSKVTISNLRHEIIYTQTEKTCTENTECFVEGTKVLSKDGYKNIEDIKVGDYVYTLNLETNEKELNLVEAIYLNATNEIVEITTQDEIILTTPKHRFFIVDRGWVRAKNIKIGDKLSTLQNVDSVVKNINFIKTETKLPVYNFKVQDHHNYLITNSDYLVHNMSQIPF